MSSPLAWAPLLKGGKISERPGAHSDNYDMSVELLRYAKFDDFVCRRYSLMKHKWSCSKNLFQIMQYNNIRNLNRVIFTQMKHLESEVNAFWYYFKVIKRDTFHYLLNKVPVPGN